MTDRFALVSIVIPWQRLLLELYADHLAVTVPAPGCSLRVKVNRGMGIGVRAAFWLQIGLIVILVLAMLHAYLRSLVLGS